MSMPHILKRERKINGVINKDIIVMSGGGARGAAQAGMLQALYEAGVQPEAYVGCSVGAINAAFMACSTDFEYQVQELQEKWRRITRKEIFRGTKLRHGVHLLKKHPYLYDATGLKLFIQQGITHHNLEDLPISCRVVTTNVSTGKPTYHDKGRLDEILLASAAIPGVFPPVELPDPVAGKMAPHVDGGIADLVPLSGAIGLNPGRIFILDISTNPLLEEASNPVDALIVALGVSARLRSKVDFGRPVQVVEIRLPETRVGLTDFSQSERLIQLGYETAKQALKEGAELSVEGKVKVSPRAKLPTTPPWPVAGWIEKYKDRRALA